MARGWLIAEAPSHLSQWVTLHTAPLGTPGSTVSKLPAQNKKQGCRSWELPGHLDARQVPGTYPRKGVCGAWPCVVPTAVPAASSEVPPSAASAPDTLPGR